MFNWPVTADYVFAAYDPALLCTMQINEISPGPVIQNLKYFIFADFIFPRHEVWVDNIKGHLDNYIQI